MSPRPPPPLRTELSDLHLLLLLPHRTLAKNTRGMCYNRARTNYL